jgi:hypothetical protein
MSNAASTGSSEKISEAAINSVSVERARAVEEITQLKDLVKTLQTTRDPKADGTSMNEHGASETIHGFKETIKRLVDEKAEVSHSNLLPYDPATVISMPHSAGETTRQLAASTCGRNKYQCGVARTSGATLFGARDRAQEGKSRRSYP